MLLYPVLLPRRESTRFSRKSLTEILLPRRSVRLKLRQRLRLKLKPMPRPMLRLRQKPLLRLKKRLPLRPRRLLRLLLRKKRHRNLLPKSKKKPLLLLLKVRLSKERKLTTVNVLKAEEVDVALIDLAEEVAVETTEAEVETTSVDLRRMKKVSLLRLESSPRENTVEDAVVIVEIAEIAAEVAVEIAEEANTVVVSVAVAEVAAEREVRPEAESQPRLPNLLPKTTTMPLPSNGTSLETERKSE